MGLWDNITSAWNTVENAFTGRNSGSATRTQTTVSQLPAARLPVSNRFIGTVNLPISPTPTAFSAVTSTVSKNGISGGGISAMLDDNTMLYLGIGGAALIVLLLVSR